MLTEKIKSVIRDVPNFPKQGILFKDITPIMLDAHLSNEIVLAMKEKYANENIDAVAGIESRGFLLGYPLAMALGVPFILIRKKGKLPYHKESHAYDLEYGSAEIEVHKDAIKKGQRILIHDDLLATGGSAEAAACLVEKCGGKVVVFDFLVVLEFLEGKNKLTRFTNEINHMVNY